MIMASADNAENKISNFWLAKNQRRTITSRPIRLVGGAVANTAASGMMGGTFNVGTTLSAPRTLSRMVLRARFVKVRAWSSPAPSDTEVGCDTRAPLVDTKRRRRRRS
jgi:hypothetical protein